MMLRGAVSPFRRLSAVSLYFGCHLAAAVLLALPVVALVAGTGIGRFPEGDRLLFEPGGLLFAEVGRELLPTLPSQVASGIGTGAMLGLALLLPHAALLVSFSNQERKGLASTWGRAFGHLPALLSLGGLALLAQVIVLAGALAVGQMLRGAFSASARSADLAFVAALALGVLFSALLGITRDLGRAAAVRGSLAGKEALLEGLRAFARAPGRAFIAWAMPAAAAVAFVALGAVLTAALDVSRPSTWRVWSVALLHQAIAFALCFCRAFWLSASFGIVGAPSPNVRADQP
ncbi:MAG TPA: hypothetical protein VF103_13565 [Polyangiaceae bacterium]